MFYFVSEQTKVDQDYALNGERLTSLHAKLHQEADKIRKWKNQIEIDLKQKVTQCPLYMFLLKLIQIS